MKKIVLLSVLFLAAALACAYAHTPSDVKLSFNLKTKMLRVAITHDTPNPTLHYIKRVNVELNGKQVINEEFTRQDNELGHTVSYKIPNAKPGDIITVYVRCNIVGRLKRKITLE